MKKDRLFLLLFMLIALAAVGPLASSFADGPAEAEQVQGASHTLFLPLLQAQSSATGTMTLIPDSGIGFDLSVPASLEVRMPDELQEISVAQLFSSETQTKVEIAAERLPETLSYSAWQSFQQEIGSSYETTELKVSSTTVDGYPARLREIQAPDGVIWETEVYVGHTVYRISTLAVPGADKLYATVLAGLAFSSTNALPINDVTQEAQRVMVPSVEDDPAAVQGTMAMPTLKFPFNGSKYITCAYYANNANCHPQAKIALDFNLNKDLVRAAHAASSRINFYDSCAGTQIKLVATDTTYWTIYSHLYAYLGPTTGAVLNGQYIAVSGNTGSCTTGPHLHWLLNRSGTNIKPEPTCGLTGFLQGQTRSDCWSLDYRFTPAMTSQLIINTNEVRLTVCDTGRKGRPIIVSMWRPAVSGYTAKGWTYQGVLNASTGCVTFADMDGAGSTFAGIYYFTNVSLYQDTPNYFPANTAIQQKTTSCFASTNQRVICNAVRR